MLHLPAKRLNWLERDLKNTLDMYVMGAGYGLKTHNETCFDPNHSQSKRETAA